MISNKMAESYNEEYTLRLSLQGRRLAHILAYVSTSYITILFELIREYVVCYVRVLMNTTLTRV